MTTQYDSFDKWYEANKERLTMLTPKGALRDAWENAQCNIFVGGVEKMSWGDTIYYKAYNK